MKEIKVLFLGAAKFQTPPILYAKSQGYRAITCDNRPENPGHTLADKYYNISTANIDHVLSLASNEKIDGVVAFGSDIAAKTAAVVSECLNLPGNPVNTVEILTNKHKFRKFLSESGLQFNSYKVFGRNEFRDAISFINSSNTQLVIKPTDSAGSKGVAILLGEKHFIEEKVRRAFEESPSKTIIIEDYFMKSGYQICGDGYFENGKIKYIFFGNGHFYDDMEHNAPWGETFPSCHGEHILEKVSSKIEEILKAAGFNKGVFNHDILVNDKGEIFVIEIAPRAGGNFIPEAIRLKYSIDLVVDCVESSLSNNYESKQKICENDSYYSCYMLHSLNSVKKYSGFDIDSKMSVKIVAVNEYLKRGEFIYPFTKGSAAIANIILKFDTYLEMLNGYKTIHNMFKIKYDE